MNHYLRGTVLSSDVAHQLLKMAQWRPSFQVPGEKVYTSGQFRVMPPGLSCTGGVRRHRLDCELMAVGAAYSRGPRYSDSTLHSIAATLGRRDNFYSYGTSTANTADRRATNRVLQAAYTGERVVLSAREAAHIRAGGRVLAAHKDELPAGYVHSMSEKVYRNVYDTKGHKVVDRRSLRR